MRVSLRLRAITRWISNMQWLFLSAFILCVFASPFEFPSDPKSSYTVGANQTSLERSHLYKGATDYSSIVTWGSECDAERIRYLSEELDETKTMVSITSHLRS